MTAPANGDAHVVLGAKGAASGAAAPGIGAEAGAASEVGGATGAGAATASPPLASSGWLAAGSVFAKRIVRLNAALPFFLATSRASSVARPDARASLKAAVAAQRMAASAAAATDSFCDVDAEGAAAWSVTVTGSAAAIGASAPPA